LGITNFSIQKCEDKFYRIVRENENENNFESLSEGEKMIISFFYFVQLCLGKEKENEIDNKKIIVIDDPISSLSHIYIFNLAQLIKKDFFAKAKERNFENIFVLTHSLYFFYELSPFLNKKTNEKKFFRLSKDKNSKIREMVYNEIQNDYQAYWQIIKDSKCEDMINPIIPNVMRNILEHFFGFIDNTTLDEVIKKIDQQKYGAFIRYIQRESHSDRSNISDYKEINIKIFLSAFREVFQKSGYIKHHQIMLGEVKDDNEKN